jgi:hypothetical protein
MLRVTIASSETHAHRTGGFNVQVDVGFPSLSCYLANAQEELLITYHELHPRRKRLAGL